MSIVATTSSCNMAQSAFACRPRCRAALSNRKKNWNVRGSTEACSRFQNTPSNIPCPRCWRRCCPRLRRTWSCTSGVNSQAAKGSLQVTTWLPPTQCTVAICVICMSRPFHKLTYPPTPGIQHALVLHCGRHS